MSETHFPLDESKLPFSIPKDAQPREKILKLGRMITDRIPAKLYGLTAEDPEYWGLAGVVTDEMADVALKMKVRKPMTLSELVKATGKPAEELEPLLYQMSCVGLLEYNWENERHEKQYVLPMFVPGSAEFFNMHKQQIQDNPEVTAFFERMTFLPLEHITAMVPPGGAGIGMHVIPVEKAIETENRSADIEHISHWLKKYEGKYAASPCSCRMSRARMGEGCADDPEDWCIGVGDMADYLVETKKGHYVTYDEVLEILRRAEDNGFVHQITNIDGENKIFAICNCNVNICNALRTSQLFNTPNMSRSAYVAKVKTENCVACGRCVEYCPAGAVKLGQKLCTQNGPVEYPRQELPDAVKWGPEKWDVDYRDNNRINCYDAGTAPCKTACPAHIAVQGYLKMAAQGRYTDALALIKKENPFPAVCGRVCNRRCEDACTRGTVDQAVAIDEVKKFIAQQDLNAATRYVPPVVAPTNRGGFAEKIAVIGAGPAGLSCAYYLAERGYKPTVFEKNERPGGMLVYKSEPRSYKDLPLRMGELGLVHRHEKSGALHGLFRVRCFTQDDAHIFMRDDQIEDEIKGVTRLINEVYTQFGFEYFVELSTRPEDSMGSDEDWEMATNGLRKALEDMGLDYIVNEGDGAFYGPKIDFHLRDSLGRTWQCGTIQLDFQMPQRFDLEYTAEDGSKKRPIMIHRVCFGSIERFIGILIEHFAGKFPVWLAPVQVKVIPVSEKSMDYATGVYEKLKAAGIRTELDHKDEKVGYKIRQAQLEKVPYMLVLGEKEAAEGAITVRSRDKGDLGAAGLDAFIEDIKKMIETKEK